jgi:hypothetical protein
MGTGTMQIIVDCHRQAWKVRIVTWATALWFIGFLYWGYSMSQTYGLSPGDGGVLKPAAERWSLAVLLALIGIAPLIGMAVYAGLYVTRLARDGEQLTMTVIGLLRPRTFTVPLIAVATATSNDGRGFPFSGMASRITVNAPWITLRVAGRPYIIDQQAETLDDAALGRLVNDANRAARANSLNPSS